MRRRARRPWWAGLLGLVVVLGASLAPAPAGGLGRGPAQDPDGAPAELEPFARCLEFVEWALGAERTWNAPDDRSAPSGVDGGLWSRAIDLENFDGFRFGDARAFVHKPDCMLLWPDGMELADPRWTETELYQRCEQDIRDGAGITPRGVPEWIWRNSMRTGDCYLLLPFEAFGVSMTSPFSRVMWHDWVPADQPTVTTPGNDRVATAFDECVEFVDWRMEGGTAAWDAPRSNKVPEDAAPVDIWRQALDYWESDSMFATGTVVPGEWTPDCHLLLDFLAPVCDEHEEAGSILPEKCWGPVATARYDIGYKSDGPMDLGSATWATATDHTFALGKGAVQVGLGIIDWTLLEFDIERYDPIAVTVGDNYQENLLGHPQFKLRHLFWLVLFAWAGYATLRGRGTMAGTEILITVVLLLLAGVLLENRETYMTATWDLMEKSSDALLVAGMGDDPKAFEDDCGDECTRRHEMVDDFETQIHQVFVQRPYDHLNWGRALGDPDESGNPMAPCARARSEILATGPHGSSDWPREQMANAGCAELVEFNEVASGNRLLGAVLVAVSSFSIAILIGLIALTLAVAKLFTVFLFALAPFAAVVAILPGQGRRLAWSWITSVMRMTLVVVAVTFVLSLLLILLTELLAIIEGAPVFEQFLMMNLAIFIAFVTRRTVLSSSQAFGSRLADYLSMPRGGSGGGQAWAAARSSDSGLDLLAIDRGTSPVLRGAAIATAATPVLAARSVYNRWTEDRMATRGYKNLKRLAYWKRRHNTPAGRRRMRRGYGGDNRPWAPRRIQDLP